MVVHRDPKTPKPRKGLPLDSKHRHMGRVPRVKRGEDVGPGGRRNCRWCGTETKPPRLTFCSAACVHEWQLRTSSSYVRWKLEERDKGICGSCGLNTERLLQIVMPPSWYNELLAFAERNGIESRYRMTHEEEVAWDQYRAKRMRLYERARVRLAYWAVRVRLHRRVSLWDADHILPVIEGGGCCGLSNYQTLCLRCHTAKTTNKPPAKPAKPQLRWREVWRRRRLRRA